MSWRTPNTYRKEGIERGTATSSSTRPGTTSLEELGYPPRRTIYFGESLGSAVVAALQGRHPPAGVVLRSPFTDLADVGAHHYPWLPVRALLRDRFPVVEHVVTADGPVTVIFGGRDSVVPPELSARVADRAASLAERMVLDGADHNDPVMFGPRVGAAVARLAHSVGRRGGPLEPVRHEAAPGVRPKCVHSS